VAHEIMKYSASSFSNPELIPAVVFAVAGGSSAIARVDVYYDHKETDPQWIEHMQNWLNILQEIITVDGEKLNLDYSNKFFNGADLSEIDLSGIHIFSAQNCNFNGSNITNANLACADLSTCSMVGVLLDGADLMGTKFPKQDQ
jgi:hypothetical protein